MTTLDQPDLQATDTEELAPAPEAPKNYAGRKEVAESVLKVVQDIMALNTDYMTPLWKRWRLTHFMLQGNTIDRAGPMEVHMPQLYKTLETMVPRAVGSVLRPDPWFRNKPQKPEDEQFSEAVSVVLDWQERQAGLRDQGEAAFRNLAITQVCAFQVEWRDERRKIVRQLRDRNGKITKTVSREHKVFVGPTADLIDSFDFIIDPRCTDEQKGLYVGHRCMMTASQIEKLAFLRDENNELTPFAKESINRLKKQGEQNNSTKMLGQNADTYKTERSATERSQRSLTTPVSSKSPPQYEVIQLCMQMDLLGDGVFEESILIVAGGTEVLLACRNPYTFQHRPYITARAAKNSHNFYGIGPLDNAVRLNQMLDRQHAIYMRLAEVTASPFWWVENEGADIPTSLYHARPGRVIPGAGKITQMQLPTEGLRSAPMILGLTSRNIEETVGVYGIQMGQTDGGVTATSDLTALQEGNRRLEGLFINFAQVFKKWLRVGWKLNVQFLTEPDVYPVVGKRSKDLNSHFLAVGPDSFLNEPYFEIVGVDGLENYGLRATALAQGAQIFGAMLLPYSGNRFDPLTMAHDYIASVTDPMTADRIIKVRQSRETLWSQEEENHKLRQGISVPVSPDDPHKMHMEKMQPDLDRIRRELAAGTANFTEVQAFFEHANQHVVADERQEEEEAMRAKIMPPQLPEAGGTPSKNGGPSSPVAGGMSANVNPQGETPGPMNQRTVGKVGREPSALSQTQGSVQ